MWLSVVMFMMLTGTATERTIGDYLEGGGGSVMDRSQSVNIRVPAGHFVSIQQPSCYPNCQRSFMVVNPPCSPNCAQVPVLVPSVNAEHSAVIAISG
ncbi:unnamed protein product [Soboliphyme baturini]|uniref:Secreted protein n=1 Tax=Soboliphyme baturini TaxID=241478 RepID=A0A183IU59_9BILA|nr:unnamed protein product [Soboliphyme baturini]